MDRKNIEKIARTPEDKLLLAKVWDKLNAGIQRQIPVATAFLSPREQEMTQYLFGNQPGLLFFGGYEDAERAMAVYLPEYLEADWLMGEDSPVVCVECTWFEGDHLTHRDLLGALMGAGISRESVGDICVSEGRCQLFTTEQMAPYILQNFCCAGRVKLHTEAVALSQVQIKEPETKELRDTVASLRLDSIISSGFRIGRSLAAQYITTGKAAINGLPCEKPDRSVPEGAKISVRGLGKCKLRSIGGQTKKGRISIIIDRYI